ncbi:hypothetical protein F5Y00DRAFT_227341 [Daldinia vernicosa]|uniref:uncharacterized protein n=1 Tax=Daldinia vernicosa TaxID=114800 RepID=UPI00200886FC|nr:uncharacterized protein F5Y00DRAFT_227341 [Daldinia vernicosa]KAI0852687.1 hypothetical protein F5Y00DRAFT_227341 [Daldinia vernicosa]
MPATRTVIMRNTILSLLRKRRCFSLLFARLFRKNDTVQPQKSVSYLMNLPVEIIHLISEHLPNADAVCFALTCKATFSILHKNGMQLDSQAKEILLVRLEKEVLGLIYSPFLNKLLPFDNNGKIPFNPFYEYDGEFSYFYPMIRGNIWSVVNYEQTRLVRNYRLFGPGHGVPLSFFSYNEKERIRSIRFMQNRCETYTESSRIAKWVGEALFLSCTRTVYLNKLGKRQVDITALQDFIRKIYACGRLCHHCMVDDWHGGSLYYNPIYADFPQIHTKLSENSAYQSTGSCRFCKTDWDVSIAWNDSMSGLVITYITYHDLGTCSFPFDTTWQMITGHSTNVNLLEQNGRKGLYGDVKRHWIEAV